MVAFCHGTFVAVDFRHELAQRRSKGSLSSTAVRTADPILGLLKATLLLGYGEGNGEGDETAKAKTKKKKKGLSKNERRRRRRRKDE